MSTENTKGMGIAAKVIRYLLGLIFFVFGLNGFFNFIPAPPPEGDLLTFFTAFQLTKFMYVVKAFEVIAGALLLSGLYVPLAVAILGPITLFIFVLHTQMAQEGLPMAIFVLLSTLFLAYVNRDSYKGVFARK